MHGLVNKAIEGFVRATYGDAIWQAVALASGLKSPTFEAMLTYDDAVICEVLDAAALVLEKPRDAIMEDVGTFLVSHPGVPAPRRLLRFSGTTFEDFLHSLDDLPGRVHLALPDLAIPPMELIDEPDGGFLLRCGAMMPGFGHVMVGLLQAMADEYGALATIAYRGEDQGVEHVEIRLHVPQFSEGRRFDLGLAAR